MSFTKVLAVMPVSDFEAALDWYERLFKRPPDARPMDGLADWHVTDSAWVQVYRDEEHAGTGMLNLVVGDITGSISDLGTRGIEVGEVVTTKKMAKLGPIADPDGNIITLIENPSV